MAKFYDRAVQNCSYLLMLQMLAYVAENSLRKYFKIATSLFPTGLQIIFFARVSQRILNKKLLLIIVFFNHTFIYHI